MVAALHIAPGQLVVDTSPATAEAEQLAQRVYMFFSRVRATSGAVDPARPASDRDRWTVSVKGGEDWAEKLRAKLEAEGVAIEVEDWRRDCGAR